MKTKDNIYQLLGFDPNWICVLYDLIQYNHGSNFNLDVFLNIDVDTKANDQLSQINYSIKELEEIEINFPILFGVASPKNKYPIYKDFSKFLHQTSYNNLIANSSIISESCSVDKAVLVDHQCVVSSQSSIGFGVSIKRGAKIGHHNSIGDFTDINPGVITSGNVQIGRGCEVGSGAIFKNNVTIGDNSFIGMGSVVTKDIPPNSIAFGNPCKVIRKNDMWEI